MTPPKGPALPGDQATHAPVKYARNAVSRKVKLLSQISRTNVHACWCG
jgi:hypothetical protein